MLSVSDKTQTTKMSGEFVLPNQITAGVLGWFLSVT